MSDWREGATRLDATRADDGLGWGVSVWDLVSSSDDAIWVWMRLDASSALWRRTVMPKFFDLKVSIEAPTRVELADGSSGALVCRIDHQKL